MKVKDLLKELLEKVEKNPNVLEWTTRCRDGDGFLVSLGYLDVFENGDGGFVDFENCEN